MNQGINAYEIDPSKSGKTNTEIDSYNNGDISSIETDELLFYYDF